MRECAALTFIASFPHRWYTQQNPPRARTYSWSRNPRPGLDPQQRPGSAPLYGRLCYGLHTLPVLRDYPAGPLEAGLQLTRGLSGAQIGSSLLIQNQSTVEPLLGSTCYDPERVLSKSEITKSNDGGEAGDAKDAQNEAKVRI